MNIPAEFLTCLQEKLSRPLPGEMAQKSMARIKNYAFSDLMSKNPGYKKSAVMVVLWEESSTLRCLLIQRPEYEGVHSGQVALPGGKQEPYDSDLLATAIRETKEEVGFLIPSEYVAGPLSPLYIPVSNFLVQPYIAVLPSKPELNLNLVEVHACLDFDLSVILDESSRKMKEIQANGMKHETPYFEIEGLVVWGATAMVLSELSAVLKSIISS